MHAPAVEQQRITEAPKRGWKKLRLGVHRPGAIVAHALTDGATDGAKTRANLLNPVEADVIIVIENAEGRHASVIGCSAALRQRAAARLATRARVAY